MRSSLVIMETLGRHVTPPDKVRIYLISGTRQGDGASAHVATPSFGTCQKLSDPMALSRIRRVLTFIPFAVTRAERLASRDPQRSFEERYKTREKCVHEIAKAAKEIVRDRYLLQSNADPSMQIVEESDVDN